MKFEITAVITDIGAIEEFGQKGFQKRNLILSEQNGEYVNPVCIEWSGEKIARPESHQVGQMVKVSGFINCREWEGRYFTSLAGSFIENAGEQPQQPAPAPAFGTQEQAQAQIAQPQVQQPVNAVAPQQPVAQPQVQQYATPQPVAQPQYAPQVPQAPYQQQPANMAPPQQPVQNLAGNIEVEDSIPF